MTNSNRIVPAHLLIEVVPGMYHIFPPEPETIRGEGGLLERAEKLLVEKGRRGKGQSFESFRVDKITQPDGSRFRVVKTQKIRGIDIVSALKGIEGWIGEFGKEEIWVENSSVKRIAREGVEIQWEKVLEGILEGEPGKDWIYISYRTHIFLNGERHVPVIVRPKQKTFYALSGTVFAEIMAEDGFGVLVEEGNIDELVLRKWSRGESEVSIVRPIVINYLSTIRLCKHCGCVSDISAPKRNPWLAFKRELRKRRNRKLKESTP